jgi:hypothetical protein
MKLPKTTTVTIQKLTEDSLIVELVAGWHYKEYERILDRPIGWSDGLFLEIENQPRYRSEGGTLRWPSFREGQFQALLYMATVPDTPSLGLGGYVLEAVNELEEHNRTDFKVSSEKLLLLMEMSLLYFFPPETKRGRPTVEGPRWEDFQDTV